MKEQTKHKAKILITGLGRHGKDSLAEVLLKKYGMTFTSSSLMAAKIFIFDTLKDEFGYKTVEECYERRHEGNGREIWHNLIKDYNKEDPARLAKEILSEYDIYCGMRSKRELDECVRSGLFDLTFWVDAEDRLGVTEGPESIDICKDDCMFILDNNGPEEGLEALAEQVWDAVQYVESRKP